MTFRPLLLLAISLATLLPAISAAEPDPTPRLAVDWPEFLARQDLVWEQLPLQWNEGAFVGNGQVGTMVYATMNDNRIDFTIGRQDVTDHRKAPDAKSSMGVPGASVMYDFPRLDIGLMALRPAGKILSGTVRQDLWNAEIRGTVVTDLGEIRFRAFTPRDRMVNVVEVVSTEKISGGQPAPWKWELIPGNPASPRARVLPDRPESKTYQTNPPPQTTTIDGVPVCVQPLLAGGDYATAWLEKKNTSGSTLYFSTANEIPAAGKSAPLAVRTVKESSDVAPAALESDHRAWWHAFYQKSFLTIPDGRLESFYWIQLYKMASCSREDGPAVDLFGPFFKLSQWPGLWWNLNIQLTYWIAYASNHLELGENMLRCIDDNFDGLFKQKETSPQLGDFAWAMHNYWWHLRFAGDWQGVEARWFPKAVRIAAAFQKKLSKGPDGKLHLAPMGSPEFKSFTPFPDTNYNLALLRWLLNALIEADARTGGKHPDNALWKQTLADLTPYPTDKNGLMIAANQPFDMSHRHYSHLIALYPLFQLSPDSPPDRELVKKSLLHWHKIGGGKALAGYSFTGAVSLYAALGMGDEANKIMQTFLTGKTGISAVLPNTFYVECGSKSPCIETPLSGASATIDLVLQSWGGKLRVFPALPKSWKNAAFYDLRGMGAFLVGASLKNGKTEWVSVKSLAGEPCVLKVPDWNGPIRILGSKGGAIAPSGPGEYTLPIGKGEQLVVAPEGTSPSLVIEPVPQSQPNHFYGVKKGKQLPPNQVWPEPGAAKP